MRSLFAAGFAALSLVACGGHHGDDGDDQGGVDACVGLECQIVNCAMQNKSPTTLTGTVFAPNGTLLPKNKTEGDIPKMALTTGSGDSLECLIRKLGIDDPEVTTEAGTGRVHFYTGNGVSQLVPGGALSNATALWSTVDTLKKYDI